MKPRPATRGTVTWLARAGVSLVLLAAGWGVGALLRAPRVEAWGPRTGKVRVLTTILPLYDFARQIGGADVEVRNLLPPGVDPHEFALSPRDAELVAGSDVLICNGAGLDDFIRDAIRTSAARDLRVATVSDGLPLLASAEKETGEHAESGDPHLWLDPVYARVYADRTAAAIEDALTRTGHAHEAADVRVRAARLHTDLSALDGEFRSKLRPLAGRAFIAFHGAFRYLAERYGLRVAAVWQSTPGREPAPREVGALLRIAREQHVEALFSEPQFSPRAIEMIAADAHLPVYTLDPMETAEDLDSTHYAPTMQHNLQALVEALAR